MSQSITLTVNGVERNLEITDPRVTLLDLLRETLDLTGITVMIDVDLDGNVLGIELLGDTELGLVDDLHLTFALKNAPNTRNRKVD